MDFLRGLKTPKVSIIDLSILGILALPFMSNPFHRGSYLIFYSIFLFCLSQFFAPKNNYKSVPVVIFLLTSLALIFVHRPYKIVPNSIINSYFNIAIMSEGFIYILAGYMLFITIIRYSKNYNFILIMALLVSIVPIKFILSVGSTGSLSVALALSILTYLVLNKKMRFLIDSLIIGIISFAINWKYIFAKSVCRPQIWIASLKEIKQHPFLGIGFNQTVMPDGLFPVEPWGWVYKHNVFLTIWSSLGIVALIAIIWFVVDSLRQIGKTIYLIPFLFLVLFCNMKETMLIPERAGIVIVILACCIRGTLKKESV